MFSKSTRETLEKKKKISGKFIRKFIKKTNKPQSKAPTYPNRVPVGRDFEMPCCFWKCHLFRLYQ